MAKRVFAIVAHPDDIEFMMAGTMLCLQQAGYELHYMTVANGSCGTVEHDAETIIRIRRQESVNAAQRIGAVYHESLVNDLEIYYEKRTLQQLAGIVREVAPHILLTHSTQEYMEDHMNTCRLVLSAAFARGMPNFPTVPPRTAVSQPVSVYHALPYGLRDPLGRRMAADIYVDITSGLPVKRAMLAAHASQKEWLDVSQGLDSYLRQMESMASEVGQMSGRFAYAEGWIRHLHLGYCNEEADPLVEDLPASVVAVSRALHE